MVVYYVSYHGSYPDEARSIGPISDKNLAESVAVVMNKSNEPITDAKWSVDNFEAISTAQQAQAIIKDIWPDVPPELLNTVGAHLAPSAQGLSVPKTAMWGGTLADIEDSIQGLKETQKDLKGSKNPHDIEAYRNADAMIKSLTDQKKKMLAGNTAKVASMLDAIADRLESRGFLKEASDLDVISNTIEALDADTVPEGKPTVGINDFVKRQTKPDFAGTKVTTAQLNKLHKDAERQAASNQLKPGYAPYVKIARVIDPEIACPVAKITPENKSLLKTRMTKRRDFEEEFEQRYFEAKDVKPMPSHHVDIIMYSKEKLSSEPDSNPTGADWDIISINAEPTSSGTPMAPETIKRNMKGTQAGGSGHQHSPEELSQSEAFWENHAMIL
jgi:hypothetical protein